MLRHQRSKLGDKKKGNLHIERIDVVERRLAHFMRRAEREHASVIDQDVDVALSQLDGLFRNSAGARGVAQVGGYEIGFAARGPYLRNGVFTALYVAADRDYLNAGLR